MDRCDEAGRRYLPGPLGRAFRCPREIVDAFVVGCWSGGDDPGLDRGKYLYLLMLNSRLMVGTMSLDVRVPLFAWD